MSVKKVLSLKLDQHDKRPVSQIVGDENLEIVPLPKDGSFPAHLILSFEVLRKLCLEVIDAHPVERNAFLYFRRITYSYSLLDLVKIGSYRFLLAR